MTLYVAPIPHEPSRPELLNLYASHILTVSHKIGLVLWDSKMVQLLTGSKTQQQPL